MYTLQRLDVEFESQFAEAFNVNAGTANNAGFGLDNDPPATT